MYIKCQKRKYISTINGTFLTTSTQHPHTSIQTTFYGYLSISNWCRSTRIICLSPSPKHPYQQILQHTAWLKTTHCLFQDCKVPIQSFIFVVLLIYQWFAALHWTWVIGCPFSHFLHSIQTRAPSSDRQNMFMASTTLFQYVHVLIQASSFANSFNFHCRSPKFNHISISSQLTCPSHMILSHQANWFQS